MNAVGNLWKPKGDTYSYSPKKSAVSLWNGEKHLPTQQKILGEWDTRTDKDAQINTYTCTDRERNNMR